MSAATLLPEPLTFELAGPTAGAAVFVVGASVLLYGFGGAVDAWIITARLQAAQHMTDDAQQR